MTQAANIKQFPRNQKQAEQSQPMAQIGQVYQCKANMQSEISQGGLGKCQEAKDWNGNVLYRFRGIDDIQNLLAPLLSKHNLDITPICREMILKEQIVKDKLLFACTVKVDYIFTCTTDGSQLIATMYGQANDYGDKAISKAMSMAYKYMAIQAFCIPVQGEDPDAFVHEPINPNQRQLLNSSNNHAQQHQNGQQSRNNAQQHQNGQQSRNNAQQHQNGQQQPATINKQQEQQLLELMHKSNYDPNRLLQKYQLNNLSQITVRAFNELCIRLANF